MRENVRSVPGQYRPEVDELGHTLQALFRTMKAVRRGAQRHDLHYASLRPLSLLEDGARRVSDIALSLGEDISTTSRRVSALADEELVEKLPDPSDQRAQLIAMTDRGGAVLEDVRASTREALGRALAQWSDAEVGTAVAQLRRLDDDLTAWVESLHP